MCVLIKKNMKQIIVMAKKSVKGSWWELKENLMKNIVNTNI